jgi:hypothetical protein
VLVIGGAVVGFGQQAADPDFDVKVTKPAYTDQHPKVLFDEAHRNFQRYKPFVDLIRNDGCQVTANAEPFTKKSLAGSASLADGDPSLTHTTE